MARYPGLTLRVLRDGGPAMGPGKAALIEQIDSLGSISAAAREMGMSYRRAWQLVEALNDSFAKPIVITEVGGQRGGGASVTPFGRRIVAAYRAMEQRASGVIAHDLASFRRHLKPSSRRGKPV